MSKNKELNFSLSFMEVKALLEELEFSMRIKNKDGRKAELLYETIATQLNGAPVVVFTREEGEK